MTPMNQVEINQWIEELVEEKVNQKINERFSQLQEEMLYVQQTIKQLKKNQPKDKVSLLVTSHELDKLLPAFIIANGAASFGMEVNMFFTLWGIMGLKKESKYSGKNIKAKILMVGQTNVKHL